MTLGDNTAHQRFPFLVTGIILDIILFLIPPHESHDLSSPREKFSFAITERLEIVDVEGVGARVSPKTEDSGSARAPEFEDKELGGASEVEARETGGNTWCEV